ncbi:MAG: YdcF family protein [Silvanigrellaceae bacterium]|nr:YdcF family protein [Silvanigrellaceae bacterium]
MYVFIALCFTALIIAFAINFIIFFSNPQSTSPPVIKRDYAIVLGASVRGKELSNALRFRMETAVLLYKKGYIRKILLSGDGDNYYYNETQAMLNFALSKNIPPSALISDQNGYNTYTTMRNAKLRYKVENAYIVSQQFHLRRALWIAQKIGIDAQGIPAEMVNNRFYYYIREFFASIKDFFLVNSKLSS